MHTPSSDDMLDHPPQLDINVLIVDDHSNMRMIMREFLKSFGITSVHGADNGVAGMDWLSVPNNPSPDVILCDLHMEPMDGLEFSAKVRRGKTCADRDTPILLLTGERDAMVLEVAEQVGVNSVLLKPIAPQDLADEIGRANGYELAC
jgi:CheY-like chemotaxis protein